MTFKKHHKKYPHRTENEIQEAIVECLKEFPRSTYAIRKKIKADHRTVMHNLTRLEYLGRVKELKKRFRPFQFSKYWSLEGFGD